MKVLVFGSTGMLAWKVIDLLLNVRIFTITSTIRKNSDKILIKKNVKLNKKLKLVKFDALTYKRNKLKSLINKYDVIINCIGVIKPNIIEEKNNSVINAIKTNAIFPRDLFNLKKKNIKVLQIATDCVFDGKTGSYNEDSHHNPTDIYGKSKSLGEVKGINFFNLRCSIIGEEIKNKKSLISWFLSQKREQKINGYANHRWNGITTTAFAKIVIAIIKYKFYNLPNTIHILPKNIVSKFQLLKTLKFYYQRKNFINKSLANLKVNRSLSTNFFSTNDKIWKLAGYKKIPSVNFLINEI
jgi:dTDP-4-dehydrorhamnose reductase